MAAWDLITAQEAKDALKLTGTGDDTYFAASVSRVSDGILRFYGMVNANGSAFKPDDSTVHTRILNGTGERILKLHHDRVKQVNNLWESTDTPRVFDASTLITATDYTLDPERGIIHRVGGFLDWPQSVKVEYVLNWPAIPDTVKLAAIRWVGYEWNLRQNHGVVSRSLGDGSVVFHDPAGMPKFVKDMLLDAHVNSPGYV